MPPSTHAESSKAHPRDHILTSTMLNTTELETASAGGVDPSYAQNFGSQSWFALVLTSILTSLASTQRVVEQYAGLHQRLGEVPQTQGQPPSSSEANQRPSSPADSSPDPISPLGASAGAHSHPFVATFCNVSQVTAAGATFNTGQTVTVSINHSHGVGSAPPTQSM
ncbi:hypothetical protein BKA70DRAFT_1420553 [Coprinopsis sp. MPI-PUGE-AT-0042]|nr:hypothetical protein BKA70DRAFT_1420553 [Coprinopsis sp. MPI-PUGE-AT-0042]